MILLYVLLHISCNKHAFISQLEKIRLYLKWGAGGGLCVPRGPRKHPELRTAPKESMSSVGTPYPPLLQAQDPAPCPAGWVQLPLWGPGEKTTRTQRSAELPSQLKDLPANAGGIRDKGLIPGGKHGDPLQHSCLENPMDRETWQATVHGVTKSQTWLKQLSSQKGPQKADPQHSLPLYPPDPRPWICWLTGWVGALLGALGMHNIWLCRSCLPSPAPALTLNPSQWDQSLWRRLRFHWVGMVS